jgi:hypothetical protein
MRASEPQYAVHQLMGGALKFRPMSQRSGTKYRSVPFVAGGATRRQYFGSIHAS